MRFNVQDLKKSKFLTQKDVQPPVLATIDSFEEVNVAKEGADPEMRITVNFKELEKPLVLNSTNGQIIAMITGSQESDNWIGKKIVLYNDPMVSFGGKLTGGIRVRPPKLAAKSLPVRPLPVRPLPAKPLPPQSRGFNPNGTRLPPNFNPNTDEPTAEFDEEPPLREPGEDDY